jgi:heme-degrading monooxygenase HmoA
MNRNEVEITLGRTADFEALVDEWAIIQGQNAGFVGATLLQAYANAGRYTLFSRWTDRDASAAAGRREQFTSFAEKVRNSGIMRPLRLSEAYESVFEVDAPAATATASSAERWIDFTLRSAIAAPTLESQLRRVAEVGVQQAPGVLSVRLRRSMGDDTKYLLLVITTDRAAARGWALSPQIRASIESNPMTEHLASLPSAEIHHVVKRYAGPALSEAVPSTVSAAAPG